ncbi:single-stranded DNA-binding protein [Clostridium estertheticum]|uniref:single-stranded DNA-binding protein n=1 Tax=Clostridium estertheticum TaxID=238834 RepID=UPI001CF2EB2B|nr:single-stranded DNA-binding protein [Clostridium estertheticum]MCB2309009.1 single-stranded DNA-binding protein [Clostridium estertheticum]MCB2346857.1 single-stranded DNA-binding protein [Clostridium estertheticum]MCB2351831.1 single-stranded DNA-binding protein [Clostridium estertheticum]WAG48435.1 single-stranded DNA-binding protein [Clostridium estertheticum]
MNKVVLVGRLTKDPELFFAKGTGTAVCNFKVAVNRRFKKEGQPDADFIPIVVFGKQAEATANYMKKGSQVSLSGNIQTSTYTNKSNEKAYKTEVVADEVNFLDSKNKNDNSSNGNNTGNSSRNDSRNNDFESASDITPIDDGDIPF